MKKTNSRIMKKIYICPEMEVVELDMFQPILAGSLPMSDTPEITNENDILAPGLGDDDLSVFGL